VFVDLLATARFDTPATSNLEVFAGVDNVFNVDPPRFPGANGSGNNILFNPVGRFFKGGIRLAF
jgi:outer membrane receptor protein involved in Fe transport